MLEKVARCGVPATDGVSRCGRDATPLKDAADWVERYRQIWTSQFDALSDYLERTEEES